MGFDFIIAFIASSGMAVGNKISIPMVLPDLSTSMNLSLPKEIVFAIGVFVLAILKYSAFASLS